MRLNHLCFISCSRGKWANLASFLSTPVSSVFIPNTNQWHMTCIREIITVIFHIKWHTGGSGANTGPTAFAFSGVWKLRGLSQACFTVLQLHCLTYQVIAFLLLWSYRGHMGWWNPSLSCQNIQLYMSDRLYNNEKDISCRVTWSWWDWHLWLETDQSCIQGITSLYVLYIGFHILLYPVVKCLVCATGGWVFWATCLLPALWYDTEITCCHWEDRAHLSRARMRRRKYREFNSKLGIHPFYSSLESFRKLHSLIDVFILHMPQYKRTQRHTNSRSLCYLCCKHLFNRIYVMWWPGSDLQWLHLSTLFAGNILPPPSPPGLRLFLIKMSAPSHTSHASSHGPARLIGVFNASGADLQGFKLFIGVW